MGERDLSIKLAEALQKARQSGKFFVTITYLEDGILHHFNETHSFPVLDIAASLQFYTEERREEIQVELDKTKNIFGSREMRDS